MVKKGKKRRQSPDLCEPGAAVITVKNNFAADRKEQGQGSSVTK